MIIKISVAGLQPGMCLVNPGLQQQDHPEICLRDLQVEDAAQIQELRDRHFTDVFIDTEQGPYFRERPEEKVRMERMFSQVSQENPTAVASAPPFDAVAAVLPQADAQYTQLVQYCRTFLEQIKLAGAIDLESSESFVRDVIAREGPSGHAMYLLSKLRSYDEYTYTHTLNVSLLATLFGKALGLSQDNLMVLGLGGLFHDIGKMMVPEKILKKPGSLTAKEMEEMRRHPEYGARLLRERRDVAAPVLRVVLEHHERHDGKGYPRGAGNGQLTHASQLMAIVDCFDALTSDRFYARGVHQHKAVCIIYNLRGSSFSPPMVDRFIRFVGIYPVGSIVVFRNGMKAIVIEQNERSLLHPKVRVILDNRNRYCPPRDVDLAEVRHTDPNFAITECLSSRDCSIHIDAYMKAPG